MKTFIAYNEETLVIMGIIQNDYSTINDMAEVFKKLDKHKIVETNKDIEIPFNFSKYKVVFDESGEFTGIEAMTQEEIYVVDAKEDGYNAAKILLGGEE